MTEPVTLDTCAQEPIHIPGSVQPHGVLFACMGDQAIVTQASANTFQHLGIKHEDIIGRSVFELFDPSTIGPLVAAATMERPPREINPVFMTHAGAAFEAVIHRSVTGAMIVELEPQTPEHRGNTAGFDHRLRASIMRLQTAGDITSLTRIAAEQVRELTGFDRVMVYRFDHEWNGEVVAEAKREDLESFLGQHYPASDIPSQARRLYTLNWLRFIVDVDYQPSPILPPLAAPLDLSFAALRSVSPIHIEYLKNMGVTASMSVSLVIDGALAGLIACHHYSGPKHVAYRTRDTAEFLGQALSWQLRVLETTAVSQRVHALVAVEAAVVNSISAATHLLDGLATPAILQLTDAQGCAIVLAEGTRTIGTVPTPDQVETLVRRLTTIEQDVVVSERARGELAEVGEHIAGVLAVTISRALGEYIIWFRPPTDRTIDWAGDPRKEAIQPSADVPARLSPRGSFALWREVVRGRSLRWESWHVEAASSLRRALLGGVRVRSNELRKLNEGLLEADRAKDDFIAVVSHELRTPLNAIVGWGELLGTGDGPRDKIGRGLEVIARNAKALTDLVDDLLDVSRMVGGKLSLEIDRVETIDLINEVLDAFAVAATAKDIRVKRILDSSTGPVLGDAARLRQVVANLMSNAVKFTPKGGSITVSLRRLESDLELSVADTGAGIEPDMLPLVFDLFKQGDSGMNRRSRGLGIGLAIVRKIVELHGGRISVESAGKDQGSMFRVRIPMAPIKTNMDAQRNPTPRELPRQLMLAQLSCLVVDDDDDARDLVAMVLREEGATVALAPDVVTALALVDTQKFDVIVSDVGMPGQDGYELVQLLRSRGPGHGGSTPAVALTAYSRAHDRTRALQAGFNAHVPKPVDAAELITVVASLAGRLGRPAG